MVKLDVTICVLKKALYYYCFINLCTLVLTEITSFTSFLDFRTFSPYTVKGSEHLVLQAILCVGPSARL